MRSRVPKLATGAGVLVVLLAAATIASEPEPARPARATGHRVLHVRVQGDLDSLKLARDFAAVMAQAAAQGTALVLLELDANAWRPDVVWAMGDALRSAGARGVTLLADERDGRVGAGALALGLCTSRCYLEARTAVRTEAADDQRARAPAETDWERVDRELQGAIWATLKRHGADTQLLEALLSPGGDLWAVSGAAPGPPLLTTQPPSDGTRAERLLTRSALGGPSRLELSAATAVSLCLVSGTARGVGDVLAREGTGGAPGSRTTVTLASGLAEARRDLGAGIAALDDELAEAARVLSDVPRPSRPDAVSKRNRAGVRALPMLERAAGRLTRCERLMLEYPELLAETVPGTTPVGQEGERPGAAWRRAFQERRDRVMELLALARQHAERKER
ncbi:MAG TPA: hypothetical protein VD963_01845 [Phycisphaerales bacterium]|nr:hypothetical protein [Phycisphaerales bacterium]